MEKFKIQTPNIGKTSATPKINKKALKQLAKQNDRAERTSERRYRVGMFLTVIGVSLSVYGCYLTYIGLENSKEIKKQEQKIIILEQEINKLKKLKK